MDFGDITKKAESFLKDDRVKDALQSDQAEDISDKVLEGVAGAVDNATGGKFHDQIDDVKHDVDTKVGNK